jgi:tetratricopeptide (TPR) repeat protein
MLVSYLEHRDPRVRQVAISQIANLANASQAHPGAVDAARAKIIALLTERSPVYQDEDLARLIEAVGQSKLFPKEKPQATEGSSERGEGKRTTEAGDSPQELVRLLESALASDSDRMRAAAASALRNFARDLVEPAPLLAAFVQVRSEPTPDVPLMQQLLRTLAVHWRTGDLSVFTEYLESAPPEIKLELLDTLAAIGDRSVLPALEAAMDPARLGTNFKLRFRAVAALGQVAGRLQATDPSLGNELVSVFGRGLQDEEAEVRVQCAQEIGRLNAQSGLDLLVDRLERKNERNQAVRDALIAAIAETAGGRRAALEILARTLAKEPKKIATGNGSVESKADDALHAAIAKVADGASAGERLSRWAWVARYLIEANAHSASAWALDNLLRRMPSPLPDSLPEGLAPDLNTPDRIRFAMGSAYVRADQPANAAKAFMDITPAGIDELSKQPQFWQMRAQLADSQAKFDLAASSYEELAKRLKPGEAQYSEALRNAARAYVNARQPERACILMDSLLQSHPDDLDFLFLGGVACMDKGDFSRALERLTKVFESDLPVDPRRRFDVLEKICEIYRVQGDKESPKRLLRNFKLPAALLDEFGPRLEQLKAQAGLP